MFDFYANSNARAQETLSADSVEQFLREKQLPVLIENGGMSCTVPRKAGGAESWFRQSYSYAVTRAIFPLSGMI